MMTYVQNNVISWEQCALLNSETVKRKDILYNDEEINN